MTETYRGWEGVSIYTFNPDEPEDVDALLEAQNEEQWESVVSRGNQVESVSDVIRHEAFAVQRTSGVLQHIKVTHSHKHEDLVDGLVETSQHDFVRSETPRVGDLSAFTIMCDCQPTCLPADDSCRNKRVVKTTLNDSRLEFLERDPYAGYTTTDPVSDALSGTQEWLNRIGGVYRTCSKCNMASAESAKLCVNCEKPF